MSPLVYAAAGAVAALILVLAIRAMRRRARRPKTGIEQAVAMVQKEVRTMAASSIEAIATTSIGSLARWAETHAGDIKLRSSSSGEVTLMFSDIENSTSINHEIGDKGWMKLLKAHDSIVDKRVAAHEGTVVKSQGDGVMVTFVDADAAVRCAVEMQEAFAREKGALKKHPIRVRIGLHSGEAIAKDGDFFGRNVALAARVAELADGGEILASSAVKDLADDDALRFGTPREVELKGLPGPHVVLPVEW